LFGRAGLPEDKRKNSTIREPAPRLVLRTACETLPAATRARVLARKT
jgi:hypothetical protein